VSSIYELKRINQEPTILAVPLATTARIITGLASARQMISASVEGRAWTDVVLLIVAAGLDRDAVGNDTVDIPAAGNGCRSPPRNGVPTLLDSFHSSKDISIAVEILKLDFSGIGGAVEDMSCIDALFFHGITLPSVLSVSPANFEFWDGKMSYKLSGAVWVTVPDSALEVHGECNGCPFAEPMGEMMSSASSKDGSEIWGVLWYLGVALTGLIIDDRRTIPRCGVSMKVRVDISVSPDSDPSKNERSSVESRVSDPNEPELILGNDGKGFLSTFSKFGRWYSMDNGDGSRFDFCVADLDDGGRCGWYPEVAGLEYLSRTGGFVLFGGCLWAGMPLVWSIGRWIVMVGTGPALITHS
jgi:hypothetical protein